MTYSTQVLALSGLLAYWPLDDTAGGTTAADAGPNTLPLTYSAAKVDAASIVAGLATSAQGNGTTMKATRAAASIAALQTSNYTIAGWIKGAKPGSLFRGLFGIRDRAELILSTTGATGRHSAATVTTPPYTLPDNEAMFVAIRYSGTRVRVYVNADLYTDARSTTNPSSTSKPFEIFTIDGGSFWDGVIGGVFVLNRPITEGELRSLYLTGTNVTPQTATAWLDTQDTATLAVNTSAASVRDATNGGLMKALSPRLTVSGQTYRAADYAISQIALPDVAPTTSSTPTECARDMVRFGVDQLKFYTRRPLSARGRYFDTGWVTADLGTTGMQAVTAAAVFPGYLRHYAKAPRDHWTYYLTAQTIEQILGSVDGSTDRPSDAYTGGVVQFPFGALLEMILMVRDVAPKADLKRWTAAMVAMGNSMWSGKGAAGAEFGYYTNGNIELHETLGYYLLYRLTGTDQWRQRFEDQLAWTVAPSTASGSGGAHGLKYLADQSFVGQSAWESATGEWADQSLFLTERGSNLGSDVTGLDWGYVTFQVVHAADLYHWSGDIRALRLLNGLWNTMYLSETSPGTPRLNRSTWSLDGTGGTRHGTSTDITTGPPATLIWGGHRPDLDQFIPQKIWVQANDPALRAQRGLPAIEWYRALQQIVGTSLASSPLWPGFPT